MGRAEPSAHTIGAMPDLDPSLHVKQYGGARRLALRGVLVATVVLLGACGGSRSTGSSGLADKPTPSIKPLSLGSGATNAACQLASRLGAAQVLGIKLPDTVTPYAGSTLHGVKYCFIGKVVSVDVESTTLEHGGCIFQPIDEVRLLGHVACLNYGSEPSVEVAIEYRGLTDATLTLTSYTNDHATLRKQLSQLGTNLVAATK